MSVFRLMLCFHVGCSLLLNHAKVPIMAASALAPIKRVRRSCHHANKDAKSLR